MITGLGFSEEVTLLGRAEDHVSNIVQWLRLAIEAMGAVVIALGIVVGIVAFARAASRRQSDRYTDMRLMLARYLAVALEFQLAADILSTAIAPSWDQIGKLGAIAVIRTGLNFFLSRELESEAPHLHVATVKTPETSPSSCGRCK